MFWASALAVYILFWALCLFLVLPFGVKTSDEMGVEKIRGQADSAPANFQPWRVVIATTLLSAAIFGLWYANWNFRWLDSTQIGFIGRPPDR